MDDRAIYADRGEWTDQRTISVEVNSFNDGFRYRNASDDVPPVRGEQVRAAQRLHTATLRSQCRTHAMRRAQRHCGNQADQCTREQ